MPDPDRPVDIERFTAAVLSELYGEAMGEYRRLFAQPLPDHAEPAFRKFWELVQTFSPENRRQFFEMLTVVTDNTASTIFGILDGTTGSELHFAEFEVRSLPDGPNLAGLLQDHFWSAREQQHGGPF